MTDERLADQAAEAFIYGFPLVFDLEQVDRLVTVGLGATPATPFNQFGHARALAGPADTFVSVNNDTLYSIAQIDLGVGPIALHVPDTAGRYYVLQFVDAWTNNFAYVGHRATGTAVGDFLLVPPEWNGAPPDGTTIIRFPTRVGSIIGRWACSGTDDLRAVHLLQDAMTLEALDPDAVAAGLPVPDPRVPDDLYFLEQLRVWSQAFPPATRDAALQAALADTGIGATGDSPYVNVDETVAIALRDGLELGRERLETILTSGSSPEVNGWKLTLHAFDYNLDFFEVGALDDDRFRIADPTLRIMERAASARGGLWGNHAYEAAYIMTYVDDQGEQLDRRADVHAAPRSDAPRRCVLVADHVRDPGLLPRRQRDRPLLDRGPDAGPRLRDRRLADDHHRGRPPGRLDRRGELAAGATRHVPAGAPDVRAGGRRPRPHLRGAGDHARLTRTPRAAIGSGVRRGPSPARAGIGRPR